MRNGTCGAAPSAGGPVHVTLIGSGDASLWHEPMAVHHQLDSLPLPDYRSWAAAPRQGRVDLGLTSTDRSPSAIGGGSQILLQGKATSPSPILP